MSIERPNLAERLQRWLRSFLFRDEGHETFPLRSDIELTFSFSRHGGAEHLAQAQQLFAEADVYIPEGTGADPKLYQDIADGKISPEEFNDQVIAHRGRGIPPYAMEEFKMIYDSHKPIIIADIPIEHPATKKFKRYYNLSTESTILFSHGDVEQALTLIQQAIQSFAEAQAEREQYVISTIKQKLPELKDSDPRLADKPKINALLQWGSLHTTLYLDLRKTFPSQRYLDEQPVVFSPSEEIVRAHRLHKPVRPELYSHELVADCLLRMLPGSWLGDSRGRQAIRTLVKPLTIEDVKRIGRAIGAATAHGDYSEETIRTTINQALQPYHLAIPRDEAGFNTLLQRPSSK